MQSQRSLPILKRPRVIRLMEQTLEYPLTLITAPIGFGKTTAMKQFLAEHPELCYFLPPVTPAGLDDAYFWRGLVREIRRCDTDTASQLAVAGFPTSHVQLSRIMDILIRLELERDYLVIIEDYYLVETSGKNMLLKALVWEGIPRLHVVLLSRKPPMFSTAELEMKRIALHLDHTAFAFTREETVEYLLLAGAIGDEATNVADIIYARTDGWITAIYLLAACLLDGRKAAMNDSINELIRSTIFDELNTERKELLVRLSVLEEFTAGEAAFVLDDASIPAELEQFRAVTAFIEKNSHGIFKVHEVFLQFLRGELARMEIDAVPLLARAGRWRISRKDYLMAFHYLTQTGDYVTMLEVMENDKNMNIHPINLSMINRIFINITPEQSYEFPMATLKYICYRSFLNPEEGRRMWEAFVNYFETHEHPRYTRRRILAEARLALTNVLYNDISAIASNASEALELLDGEASLYKTRNDIFTLGSPSLTYLYYREPGRYKDTVDTLAFRFQDYITVTNGFGAGCDYTALAEYALETGDFNAVELNAFKAMYKADLNDQKCLTVCAKLVLARLYVFQGKLAEVQELLDSLVLEDNGERINSIDLCIGYIYAVMGEYKRIPKWLRNADMYVDRQKFRCMTYTYVVYSKAVLLSGNYVELEVLCEAMVHQFSLYPNILGQIHNRIHSAIAKYQLYGKVCGQEALKKALVLAAGDGLVMPFVENADHILPMLENLPRADSSEFTEKLKKLCRQYQKRKNGGRSVGSLITQREKEVLSLVNEGKSQKEIASLLYLSKNTVNRHMSNIYLKLDVNNKMQAVKKALQLGLI